MQEYASNVRLRQISHVYLKCIYQSLAISIVERRNQFRVHAMGNMDILTMNFSTTSHFYSKYPSFFSIYREKGVFGFKLSFEREFVFPQMLPPQTNFECEVASSSITTSSIGFHPFGNLSFVPSSAASLFL